MVVHRVNTNKPHSIMIIYGNCNKTDYLAPLFHKEELTSAWDLANRKDSAWHLWRAFFCPQGLASKPEKSGFEPKGVLGNVWSTCCILTNLCKFRHIKLGPGMPYGIYIHSQVKKSSGDDLKKTLRNFQQ